MRGPHSVAEQAVGEDSMSLISLALTARRLENDGRSVVLAAMRFVFKVAVVAILGLFVLIGIYIVLDPPFSTLMAAHRVAGRPVQQTWVPLDAMSPHLARAVIMSEDARFCDHWGVDWRAVETAWSEAGETGPRAVSTITMQTVKNMFLWPRRSYIRKALEVPISYGVTAAWSKRRTLEIYLNVAEWGPGVFGAEAAAQHHFRKPASALTVKEAALLASALPNPIRRVASAPGPRMRRVAGIIERRMRGASSYVQCIGLRG